MHTHIVYIYIHAYTHIHTYIHVDSYACNYIYIYIPSISIYTCIWIRIYFLIYFYIFIYMYIYILFSIDINIISVNIHIISYHYTSYIYICVKEVTCRSCENWQKYPHAGVACPWSSPKVCQMEAPSLWHHPQAKMANRDIRRIWTNRDLVVGFNPKQNASAKVKSCPPSTGPFSSPCFWNSLLALPTWIAFDGQLALQDNLGCSEHRISGPMYHYSLVLFSYFQSHSSSSFYLFTLTNCGKTYAISGSPHYPELRPPINPSWCEDGTASSVAASKDSSAWASRAA